MFGVDYSELVSRYNNYIPDFLDGLLGYLEDEGPNNVGIFRISGSLSKVNSLVEQIEKGQPINYLEVDIHVLSNVVKQFLRQFPDPLLTIGMYDKWVSLTDLPEHERLQRAKDLFQELPVPNALLTYRILRLCAIIAEKNEVNKMNSVNLAIIFSPNILTSSNEYALSTMGKENAAVAYLINNFHLIFKEFQIDEKEFGLKVGTPNQELEEIFLTPSDFVDMPITIKIPQVHELSYLNSVNINTESLRDHYNCIFGLSNGAYELSQVVFGGHSDTEITRLNSAFHIVYEALTAFLQSLNMITSLLPEDLAEIINDIVANINPSVQGLIQYVKMKNTNKDVIIDKTDLYEYTQTFTAYTLILFEKFRRYSSLNEICSSSDLITKYISQLEEVLSTLSTHDAFSTIVNKLQFTTLKLTSVLRSHHTDLQSLLVKEELLSLISKAEEEIGNIFEEARSALLKKNYKYGDTLKSNLDTLLQTVNEVLKVYPNIDRSLFGKLDEGHMLSSTIEQLSSIIADHQSDENDNMQFMITTLNHIGYNVTQLFRMLEAPWEHQESWLYTCQDIVESMDRIKLFCEGLSEQVIDPSLQYAIKSYYGSLNNCIIQFKIYSVTLGDGVILDGPKAFNFVSPLKDFVFMTYPFLYIYRDAVYLLEDE